MSIRKLLIYQKNIQKPLMLTDESDDTDQQVDQIVRNCFESKYIVSLETDTDKVYLRPSEITSIMITKSSEIEDKNKYSDDLKLDDTNVEETK